MDTTLFNSIAQTTLAGIWFPTDASTSNQVDAPAIFILWICGIFLVFNAGLMVFFAVRYRQTKKQGAATGATHNTALEVTWSVIPAFILGIIFIWGFRNFLEMEQAPDDPYDILVVGKQWSWEFHYDNGHSANAWRRPGEKDADPIALHVPAGRPIRLTLQSNDVIHSVFIPEMRVKKDVVPGRFNQLWFEAQWNQDAAQVRTMPTEDGGTVDLEYNVYNLYCTEFCGQDHSAMITKVYVYQQEDFDQWLISDALRSSTEPMPQVGRDIWSSQCRSCHTIDGSPGSAPTWQNLIGNMSHVTANAGTIEADEDYIRESIMSPNAVYAEGYPNGGMPNFNLSPREIRGVIEFMKTLSPTHYPEGSDALWGDYDAEGNLIGADAEGGTDGEEGAAEAEPETEAQAGAESPEAETPEAEYQEAAEGENG